MANGLGPAASYQNVQDAVLRAIRLQQKPAQQRVAQRVKAAGLRTSGVGQIPALATERTRQLGESQAIAGLGSQRLGDISAMDRLKADIAGRLKIAREQADIARESQRAGSAAALRNALIGGVAGVTGSYLGRTVKK